MGIQPLSPGHKAESYKHSQEAKVLMQLYLLLQEYQGDDGSAERLHKAV